MPLQKEKPFQRFSKSLFLGIPTGKKSIAMLKEVFDSYHTSDFREEIQHWQRLILCTGHTAYDEAADREDLLEFMDALQQLAEAFYLLHQRKNKAQKAKMKIEKQLPKKTRRWLTERNRPQLLSDSQQAKPSSVVKAFRRRFTDDYIQAELLDMLEAVIAYNGAKQVSKLGLVFFYQHLQFITRLAYVLTGD